MTNGLTINPSGSAIDSNGPNKAVITDTTDSSFAADVLDASREVPVIVDLWAPWCGPCKTLGPALEKATIEARGAVRLAKINVDENQVVARQLRVQSIPAVYAFKDGQPIDGFVGALPESQVKDFVKRLVSKGGSSPIEGILQEAELLRADENFVAAKALYEKALDSDSSNPQALSGLVHCYINAEDLVRARKTLDLVPSEQAENSFVRAASAALSLKEGVTDKNANKTAELEQSVLANKNDIQARFDLALAYIDVERHGDATNLLLEIIEKNRNWNEEAARKKLLILFDALGPKNEVTIEGRRRLSSIIFS